MIVYVRTTGMEGRRRQRSPRSGHPCDRGGHPHANRDGHPHANRDPMDASTVIVPGPTRNPRRDLGPLFCNLEDCNDTDFKLLLDDISLLSLDGLNNTFTQPRPRCHRLR